MLFKDGGFSLEENWFRIPLAPWQTTSAPLASIFWHILGFVAYALFSSRFWIQWWCAEKAYISQFPLSFWWLSLSGALLSIAYFLRIHDSVNLLGPLLGVVPYLRNLMLMRRTETIEQKT